MKTKIPNSRNRENIRQQDPHAPVPAQSKPTWPWGGLCKKLPCVSCSIPSNPSQLRVPGSSQQPCEVGKGEKMPGSMLLTRNLVKRGEINGSIPRTCPELALLVHVSCSMWTLLPTAISKRAGGQKWGPTRGSLQLTFGVGNKRRQQLLQPQLEGPAGLFHSSGQAPNGTNRIPAESIGCVLLGADLLAQCNQPVQLFCLLLRQFSCQPPVLFQLGSESPGHRSPSSPCPRWRGHSGQRSGCPRNKRHCGSGRRSPGSGHSGRGLVEAGVGTRLLGQSQSGEGTVILAGACGPSEKGVRAVVAGGPLRAP